MRYIIYWKNEIEDPITVVKGDRKAVQQRLAELIEEGEIEFQQLSKGEVEVLETREAFKVSLSFDFKLIEKKGRKKK